MTRHRPTTCPFCGRTNPLVADTTGEDDNAWPNEGDLLICWRCGEVAIFDQAHNGGLRRPNLAEAIEIAADNDIQGALAARMQMLRASGEA